MQFSILSTVALLATTTLSTPAPASTPAPSITITLFNDLECKDTPGQSVSFVEGGCGLSTGAFQSFLISPTTNPAFDGVGKGCGFIIYDDADLNCTGAPENVIAPDLGLGKCVPALLFGNFEGPLPAQAITLQCGPEI